MQLPKTRDIKTSMRALRTKQDPKELVQDELLHDLASETPAATSASGNEKAPNTSSTAKKKAPNMSSAARKKAPDTSSAAERRMTPRTQVHF